MYTYWGAKKIILIREIDDTTMAGAGRVESLSICGPEVSPSSLRVEPAHG